ncbi:MAG: ferredoxin [Candidatus Altiarchaeales archaeon]|nr:MAG: ferredoxin [Candidatus Altiarchaeales archaeon]RLI94383.1 MAG: ferredoxin [Candidatus Altiarchaeales archaeon]RLI94461.1 MAG: ferredoxin [Candidatus Altiarchaeales archaeon]HDO82017.1 4Fe-4S dicluster domain-containing protein [Candidatus Altiarchaeales archaeon]HEX54666.1 4Fe-4S dicluster domain-containing protein [Candidatus Altiarchaeales archaeon]
MVEIEIETEKCIGCGACINACPVSLFELVDEKAKVTGNVDNCVLCRACETSCPVGIIRISE